MIKKILNEGIIFLGVCEKLKLNPVFHPDFNIKENFLKIYQLYYFNFFLENLIVLKNLNKEEYEKLYFYVPVCFDIYIDIADTLYYYNDSLKEEIIYLKDLLKKIKKINEYITENIENIDKNDNKKSKNVNIRFINILMKELIDFIDEKKIKRFLDFFKININNDMLNYNKKIDDYIFTVNDKISILKIKNGEEKYFYPFIWNNGNKNIFLNSFFLEIILMDKTYSSLSKYFYAIYNFKDLSQEKEKNKDFLSLEKELISIILEKIKDKKTNEIEYFFYLFDAYEKTLNNFFKKNKIFSEYEIKEIYKNVLKEITKDFFEELTENILAKGKT
jgi:hypothetical protein